MDLSIKLYFLLILGSIFLYLQIDFTRQSIILDEQVISQDMSNLSSMNELLELNTFNSSQLTQAELIEKWLANFIISNNSSIDSIEIIFEVVETEPQILLVTVNGFNDYLLIKGRNKISYQSGVLVEEK